MEDQSNNTKPQRRGFFARLGKVVQGFIAISLTATEAMMFIMFGRTTQRTDTPFLTASWAMQNHMEWNTFDVQSGENVLKGFYVSETNPRALMVIVHGIKASTDEFDPAIRYFVKKGYAVLTFDGTACGRSGGEKTVGLQQQRFDLQAVLAYIREQGICQDLPLILFGHSAGAYGVAAEAASSGASAIICVSGFESPLDTMRYWAEHYAGFLSNVEYPFLWYREFTAKGEQANTSASTSVSNSRIPALIIHGSADDVIPLEISLYQHIEQKNCFNVTSFLVQDSAYNGHSNIIASNGILNTQLMDMISGFLQPVLLTLEDHHLN